MELNIPLAITFAVIASFGFAGGAAIQHYVVGETVEKREQKTMGLAEMWRLVRTPRWLLGLSVVGIAAVLHILALMLGPVTVVQPVGILAVPWSILLAARIYQHKVPARVWLWVTVTVAALALFTWLTSRHTTVHVQLKELSLLIAIAAVAVLAVALALGGHSGPKPLRCLAWASAGSVCYGLGSSLVRVVAEWIRHHDWLGNPVFWICAVALLVCYSVGGWMIQQGYANGPAETVVGSMTTTDPVVAVMVGLFVLGEGVGLTPFVAVSMAVLGAVSVFGVFLLSRDHPEAVEQREFLARQELEQSGDPGA